MKLKSVLGIAVVAIAAFVANASMADRNNYNHSIFESDVEALTACESIGWRGNNGNCVKNSGSGQYFCKDDTWYEITDCLK